MFGNQDAQSNEDFFLHFLESAKTAPLVELSEDVWSRVENTDSYRIAPNDWEDVEDCAVVGHPDRPRDWKLFRELYEKGAPIEAPMILKTRGILHLVSGNTRLMVARALGMTPKVLVVEMEENN